MKIRIHTGHFADSMATAREIQPTSEAIREFFGITPGARVLVKPYGGIDPRNNWDTHIVVDDWGVRGFTNGPLPE